jgi:hypothetical protein
MDGYFQFNSQINPVPSNLVDPSPISGLADPVILALANFIRQVFNTNLQPRFSQEAAACGLSHSVLESWVDGYAVAQVIAFPLNDQLLKLTDFKFPLLAVQPVSEEPMNLTLTNLATNRTFRVAWILPPLSVQQYNRMYYFLHLAWEAWLGYGSQGYDPKVNLISVWEQSGVSFGAMHGANYLPYEGMSGGKDSKDIKFPTLEFEMSLVERCLQPVTQNFPHGFNEAYIELDYVDGSNPANAIPNLIDGYVQPNITLTSCSPSSGPIAGNALLLIQGTGFSIEKIVSASQLTIAGSPAKSLTVKSPTAILAITNAGVNGSQGMLGDIILTDVQGNQYTLLDSFTYT